MPAIAEYIAGLSASPFAPPVATAKFGALVGDGSRIGANAVLAPGTVLVPNSVVKLELVDQEHDWSS